MTPDEFQSLPEVTSKHVFEPLVSEHAKLQAELANAKGQLELFYRGFGTQSEKRRVIDEGESKQLTLLDVPTIVVPSKIVEVPAHKRQQESQGVRLDPAVRFDDRVPRKIVMLDVPEVKGLSPDSYEVIGTTITARLACRESSCYVKEFHRPKIKLKETGKICIAPLPEPVLPNVPMLDISAIGGMLISKSCYHLPIYRQHQQLELSGVHISRSVMTKAFNLACELLVPIAEANEESVLESSLLIIDETPMKATPTVGKDGQSKMRQGYVWPMLGERGEISFRFSFSRGRKHLDETLVGFKGTILTDGHSAYESFTDNRPDITLAQCWVHNRRQFIKAEKLKSLYTGPPLDLIGKLYDIEREIKDKTPKERLYRRQCQSKPLVDEFFKYLTKKREEICLMPSDPFQKAVQYALDREVALRVFLDNPQLPMDTNAVERQIRPHAIGRKNWLFSWTESGAHNLCALYSLVATCKLQGISPFEYLIDVLERISFTPASQVQTLTPRLWNACRPRAESDPDKDAIEA